MTDTSAGVKNGQCTLRKRECENMEYLDWNITPEPKDAVDEQLFKYKVDEIRRELPGWYWPDHVTRWCGYKITFIGVD